MWNPSVNVKKSLMETSVFVQWVYEKMESLTINGSNRRHQTRQQQHFETPITREDSLGSHWRPRKKINQDEMQLKTNIVSVVLLWKW